MSRHFLLLFWVLIFAQHSGSCSSDTSQSSSSLCAQIRPFGPRLADGCRHVYVDMGTNIGHQVRKLFQPELYAGNPTESIFRRHFGKHRDSVCAFGFEANPAHQHRLEQLEKSMRGLGKRVHVFTSTAVSVICANVTFYQDPGASTNNEWGASLSTATLSDKTNIVSVTVPAIDMAVWMSNEVVQRYVPPGAMTPAIVMKSDIENHDMVVLSHLMAEGVLCKVSHVYGEHMTNEWIASAKSILKLANCTTDIQYLDDESGDDSLPLPKGGE
jgi:hypothetical protein